MYHDLIMNILYSECLLPSLNSGVTFIGYGQEYSCNSSRVRLILKSPSF